MEPFIQPGVRVVVQFGKGRKKYAALIRSVDHTPPANYEAKYLEGVLDENPIVAPLQIELWEWIAKHYLCQLGEVMKAALPAQFKLSSETRVVPSGGDYATLDLEPDELTLIERLEDDMALTFDQIEELKLKTGTHSLLKRLIEKGLVLLEEELKEQYKPKIEQYMELQPGIAPQDLHHIFDQLAKAPKQLAMLMKFMEMGRILSDSPRGVKKLELQKRSNANASTTTSLVEKGILRIVDVEVGRIDIPVNGPQVHHTLSPSQQKAFDQIKQVHRSSKPALLYGVTASGKTEIYVELIREVLEEGKQVLFLLPEIALTGQLVQRMRSQLGSRVGVFHSRLSQNERTEIWDKVLNPVVGDHDVVLGARSALFLPFQELGLVIVDEEHDSSFKQHEPAPRYNARDLSLVLAKQHQAHVVLGSATPALESLYNASHGLYGLVELHERYGQVQDPIMEVASIAKAQKSKAAKGPFTPELYNAINKALEHGEQVILFQNRRGFAAWLECKTCGWVPQCIHCDVSLTYHKFDHDLRCHYCGKRYKVPVECGGCGAKTVEQLGSGTEQIEEQVQQHFPTARVARMDLDTTRGKHAHQSLINDLEDGSIDILIGTQMVTKGLDLENVTLVGIMNADRMLGFPDLRAHERAFQLMAQVAGRAGRRKKQGRVVIQAYDTAHPVIRAVLEQDHRSMYAREMAQRKHFAYPPYTRLVRLTVKHKERRKTEQEAHALANDLKAHLADRVLGPEFPAVERVRNRFQMNILVKLSREVSPAPLKALIAELVSNKLAEKGNSALRVIIDVDPN